MCNMDHDPFVVREEQIFDQFRILWVESGKHLIINDDALMKRQTSGQTDPSLFASGNLQGFVADLCIQRISVCGKKLVEFYLVDL